MLKEFYTLTNLQGSQTKDGYEKEVSKFYTLTNLQGSQTLGYLNQSFQKFYTLTNLQGSQTSNEIITEPKHTGNMCKPFSNV